VRTALPEELYSTSYIAERARAYIEAQDGDKPFFLMVSFPDPHHPFNPPGRFWDLYSPDDMGVPEAFTRNDWDPPPHVAGMLAQREAGEANLAGMGTIGCTIREAQEAQALTCGMIAMIDEAIGGVIAAQDASPHSGNTVLAFTSDHGDHLGDHRLLLKGAEHYEQITRVPFIWADPQGPSAARSDAIGQTHDIAATVLARAGLGPFAGMQGIDLAPAISGGAGRAAAFIQYDHQKNNPGIGPRPRVHTLRDARYRLSVIHGIDRGELYDLQADPGEFENLWDAPQAASVKARLIERLLREEIAAVDRVPLPLALA
jgi:arylsulfatase A-like enzyme